MSVVDDIRKTVTTLNRLKDAAEKGESVTFEPREAKWIHEHIQWLQGERESLISSYSGYDD